MLELDASNANAYFNRGSTHDSLGAYDKAIADYSRALDLDRQAQLAGGGVAAAAGSAASAGSGGAGASPAGRGGRGGVPSPGTGST